MSKATSDLGACPTRPPNRLPAQDPALAPLEALRDLTPLAVTGQTVEHYMRYKDQVRIASDDQKRLRLMSAKD